MAETAIHQNVNMPKTSSYPAHKSPVTVTTVAEPLYVNAEQLAQAIPCSRRSVDNWREWGWILHLKIGGMVRFDVAAVRAALENRFLIKAQSARAPQPPKTAKAAKSR